MAENMKDPSDEQSRMDFKSKLALFKNNDKSNQILKTEKSPVRGHPSQSDSTANKPPSSRNETENTDRSQPKPIKPSGEGTSSTYQSSPFTQPAKTSDEESLNINQLKRSTRTRKKRQEGYSENFVICKGPLTQTTERNGEKISSTKLSSSLTQPTEGNDEEISTTNQSRDWSSNDMEIFQHPMCLISAKSMVNENGEETAIILQTEEKTFDQIKKIDWPIVVVAVVGLYRTGKSYLMNRLAGTSKGFALGDTIESKTKGIWAWCKIHTEQPNTVLLLLDTEGLGDVDKGDQNHDNKIFTLATLLCNCLVYNMKGAFDNDAVSKLTFITEMAKNIRFRGESSEDNQTLNLILPDFVLCLRDFSLKLKKGERLLTANEYLEESLAERKSKAERFNKPREYIRKYFAKRECFAFPVPGDGNVLENLETLSFNDLSGKFIEVTNWFVKYIYSKPPKELLASKPINGQMFITLVDRYVTAIKHGAIPDVDDAFTAVAKEENAKIEKEAMEIFEKKMKSIILPVSGNIFGRHYSKAQQEALNYLRKNVVLDKHAKHEQQAQMNMDLFWNYIKEDNEGKVKEMCDSKLQEAYEKNLKEKIEKRDFEKANGYKSFQRDIEILREEYFTALRDFEENEILWTWHGFVQRMKETERKIVEADENLTQKEREEEQRRNQENIEKLLMEQQKAQKEALEKQKQDLENHYKKLNEDRIEQEKIEMKKYEEFLNEKVKKEIALKELEKRKKEDEEKQNQWFTTRVWNALWNK